MDDAIVQEGINIVFKFCGCKGPVFEREGVHTKIKESCVEAGLAVVSGDIRFKQHKENTTCALGSFADIDFHLRTLSADREAAGTISVCPGSQEDLAVARRLIGALERAFEPQGRWSIEIPWKSM